MDEELSGKIAELEGELEAAREVIRLLWNWREENSQLNVDGSQIIRSVVKYLN